MKVALLNISRAAFIVIVGMTTIGSAHAGPFETTPYDRLKLSAQQAAVIADLDMQWKSKYLQLQPTLIEQQHHLMWLLARPNADPLDITSTQQRIGQIKEQLGGYATATYLKKRRVLNDSQRVELEQWLRHQFYTRYAH